MIVFSFRFPRGGRGVIPQPDTAPLRAADRLGGAQAPVRPQCYLAGEPAQLAAVGVGAKVVGLVLILRRAPTAHSEAAGQKSPSCWLVRQSRFGAYGRSRWVL